MKRQTLMGIATAVILASYVGISVASEFGNARKGRFLYRQNCRPCHMENPVGEIPAQYLGPDSKTQAEWKQVFENYTELPCAGHWGDLSDQDRMDILQYVHDGAQDSPTPAKCG
ncbi:c-type cytochrome [Desulfonatronum parangueonense]